MKPARVICLGRSHPGLQTSVRILVFIDRTKTMVTGFFGGGCSPLFKENLSRLCNLMEIADI